MLGEQSSPLLDVNEIEDEGDDDDDVMEDVGDMCVWRTWP